MVTEQKAVLNDEPEPRSQPKRKKRNKRGRDILAPVPGRKQGSTAVHTVLSPAHREEVHERLVFYSLEDVQAYIVQLGYVDEEDKSLISLNQLKYYRGRYVTKEDRMGRQFLGRFLREFRIRLDTIAAQESAVAIQAKRVMDGLREEEEAGTTIPQVGSDLDLLDRMIKGLHRMKQEAGLIPLPIQPLQRVQVHAEVQARTHATVAGKVEHDVASGEVKQVVAKFGDFLKGQAIKAEEQKK